MAYSFVDLIAAPAYILLFILIAYIALQTKLIAPQHKKYFMWGLPLKMAGAISVGLIYVFYYNGIGDTLLYYKYSKILFHACLESPVDGFKLIFFDLDVIKKEFPKYMTNISYNDDPPSFFIVRIAAIFNLFSFGLYSVVSIFFAVLSFSGVWAIYVTLCKIKPELQKAFAISTLFIPSVIFWGSGVLKDSVTMTALGWLFYSFYNFFILKKKPVRNIIIMFLALMTLKTVKIYIALSFVPAVFFWLFLIYNSKIRSLQIKVFVQPLIIAFSLLIGIGIVYFLSKDNERYNLDKIGKTSQVTAQYLKSVSERSGSSYYDLGDFEPTLLGMLSVAPKAIWITLFRPYIWESRNAVMIISALENMFFLCFTLYILFNTRLDTFSVILSTPYISFALIFSIIFSFAIGISTFNFGSLARYKIPMIPFYLSALFLMAHEVSERKKKLAQKIYR